MEFAQADELGPMVQQASSLFLELTRRCARKRFTSLYPSAGKTPVAGVSTTGDGEDCSVWTLDEAAGCTLSHGGFSTP
jgi:hypothetical protein